MNRHGSIRITGKEPRRLSVGLLAGACVVVAGVVVAVNANSRTGAQGSATTPTAHVRLAVAASVTPLGFSQPIALTSGASQAGVWFLAESSSQAAIFYWDGARSTLRQYSLGNPVSEHLIFGIQAALAVSPNDTVWAGINSTLIRLDPISGTINMVQVPTPVDNTAAEAHRPPEMRGFHAIESLAVDSAGNVALAMSAANSVVLFNNKSQTFSQVILPSKGKPLSLAYSSDGTLGVATADWRNPAGGGADLVDLIGSSGQIEEVHVDATNIAADGTRFNVDAGGRALAQVSPSSAVDPKSSLSQTTVVPMTVHGVFLVVGAAAVPFGSAWTLAPTTDGFAKIGTSSGQVTNYELPTYSCTGISRPPNPAQTSRQLPSASTCQGYPLSFAVDAGGNVWFASTGSGSSVNEIPFGEL